MQSVERRIVRLNWQTRTIWAEIYDPANAGSFGPLGPYIQDLEWECRMSSGWANQAPGSVQSIGSKRALSARSR